MAKKSLENNFTKEKDYKLLLFPIIKQNKSTRGGHNKETIMLNIKTFKLFCIKADTKKAKDIHEYFIKLEQILNDLVQEESNELKEQLQKIQHIEINFNEKLKKETELQRQQILLNDYGTSGSLIYIIKVKTFEDGKYIIKIGQSAKGISARYEEHKKKYPECLLTDCFSVLKSNDFEKYIHNSQKIYKHKFNKLEGHEKEIELFLIGNGLTYDTLLKTINENIKQYNEYTKADFELLQSKIENLELKNELLISHLKEQKLYTEEIITIQQNQDNEEGSLNNLILKIQELEEQNKEILKNINNKETSIFTGFKEIKKTVGPLLLQINPDIFTINKIHETVSDCIKESNFKNKRLSIEKAVTENIIYNGYRWLYCDRNDNPEEIIKNIQPSKDTKVQNLGYIAKLDKAKNAILNVYIDRKTASIENGFGLSSSLDTAVKNGKIAKDNYYILFDNCDDILKTNFIENKGVPFLYKNGIGCFDKNDNLKGEFVCKFDCIKKLHISDKTLTKILDKNIEYNDHYYKSLPSKLFV
jgi:hypothetical protein